MLKGREEGRENVCGLVLTRELAVLAMLKVGGGGGGNKVSIL